MSIPPRSTPGTRTSEEANLHEFFFGAGVWGLGRGILATSSFYSHTNSLCSPLACGTFGFVCVGFVVFDWAGFWVLGFGIWGWGNFSHWITSTHPVGTSGEEGCTLGFGQDFV